MMVDREHLLALIDDAERFRALVEAHKPKKRQTESIFIRYWDADLRRWVVCTDPIALADKLRDTKP